MNALCLYSVLLDCATCVVCDESGDVLARCHQPLQHSRVEAIASRAAVAERQLPVLSVPIGLGYSSRLAAGARRQPFQPTNMGVALLLLLIAANFEMQCFKKFIFFQTTTLIDIRPSPCPDHGRHTSACKISPPYVAPFQRR